MNIISKTLQVAHAVVAFAYNQSLHLSQELLAEIEPRISAQTNLINNLACSQEVPALTTELSGSAIAPALPSSDGSADATHASTSSPDFPRVTWVMMSTS